MSFLAKFAASKYVGDKLEDHFGPQNPRYDILITEDGRRKKIKRETPPGLSPHDERVLLAVRRKAWRYEWWVDCHCCCGLHLQFGTVTLWGLIPIIGDFISLLKALTLIRAARAVDGGLPPATQLAMLLWALVDFVIKLVPLAGDVLTAIIKPNTRNAMRFEAYLRKRGERNLLRGGRTADAPLLDPRRPAGAGAGGAPSYGTVRASGSGGAAGAAAADGKKAGRTLLPFWRKNEESDSEGEGPARR